MSYGFLVEVWGPYALFSRPEMKSERVSYDVITPSAARGLLEAVYWHPGLSYHIDRIHVLNKIAFTNVRRNEVKDKILASSVRALMQGGTGKDYIATSESIMQRASMLLKDVRYVLEFHFDMTQDAGERDSPEKFYAIASRRFRKGQAFHQPSFGCRECPAQFRLLESVPTDGYYANETLDLGYMLYDMDYSDTSNIKPMFFRAIMRNGVIECGDCEVFR